MSINQVEESPALIVVVIQGGLVQSVVSSIPMQYIVVDRDTEGADEDEMFSYISAAGTLEKVLGHRSGAWCNPKEVRQIAAGLESSSQKVVYLTYDEWCEQFKPIKNMVISNASFEGTMFETFGVELKAVNLANPARVWTYFDGDLDENLLEKAGYKKEDGEYVLDGETAESGFIGEGLHYVNRMGYFITEVPADPEATYVIYMDERLAKAAKSEA